MLNVGVIGYGGRGKALINDNMLFMDKKIRITAVCDFYQDRVDEAVNAVKEKSGKAPFGTTNYAELIDSPDVDAVVITASWIEHVPMAVYAMKAKKPVAVEVGGAYSISDCQQLVDVYEETKTPFMLLENCCYGRRELMVDNIVRQGVFGEIVHCSGGYHHDLRDEISYGRERRHYRLTNYIKRNCENYPTHELGPIAKILNINHGNRMMMLSSFASKSRGLNQYIADNKPDDIQLMNTSFNQGDIVTTVIKCAGGETIVLTLDTTLPRYYSRGFTIRGTKGMYEEFTDSIFIDKADNEFDFKWKEKFCNADSYCEKYEHPIWQKYLKDGIVGGHDGMDWLVLNDFFDRVAENKPMSIDVYDTVSWMCITALSESSIMRGGLPVEIPDFTKGRWIYDNK